MSGVQQKIDVLSYLPHRAPFLFADDAVVDEAQGRAWITHTFRPDEPYFAGHFPGDPIVPGVVLLECMAQAARLFLNKQAGKIIPGYLVGVDTAKFNKTVRPHQTIVFDCKIVRGTGELTVGDYKGAIHSFKCAAYHEGVRCARAQINLYQAIANVEQQPIVQAAVASFINNSDVLRIDV
ncbi:MAG: 3-hydroxyacyl-ACP dehydratase FabZ family protein [Pseudomonadota bacterium]